MPHNALPNVTPAHRSWLRSSVRANASALRAHVLRGLPIAFGQRGKGVHRRRLDGRAELVELDATPQVERSAHLRLAAAHVNRQIARTPLLATDASLEPPAAAATGDVPKRWNAARSELGWRSAIIDAV
jgi:hypothetical protein